jgi:peptide/nickel transport system substrate-binding protein
MTRLITNKRATAAAATVGVAALLAACGSSATPVVGAKSTAGSAVSPGGLGTVNWEWELPTSWDPVTSTAGWDVHVLSLVYASVTRLDAAGAAGPGLASKWTYAPNGKSVTFTLRTGLKFSDGTPLDATAVKANIKRGLNQANSTLASTLSVISKVVVDSPTQFTLDLDQVDYQIPDLLAGKNGMIVSPTAFTKDAGSLATKPVGSGPFVLTSYVTDSHADLARNPGYWDAADIHLAKFSVQSITDPQQILAALESGEVNVAYIPGNLVAAAKKAGLTIDDIPALPVVELDVQTTKAPFTNPKVVEAINYAIDRNALLQVQQAGYGSISYQPFPKGYVGYDPKLANLYPYDPAKARQLLAQVPGIKGVTLNLTNYQGATESSLAEQLQSQLGAVGLKVAINDIPEATATQYLYVNKSIPFAIDGTAGRESPVQMLQVLYDQKGLMDVDGKTGTEPIAVVAALNQAETIPLTSSAYPATLQKAVATAVTDDPIHVWLYNQPRIFAVSPKVTGIAADLVQQRWEGVRVG